jgi:hypothetical protein
VTPVIIDAGPCLNFLATNNERILFASVGKGVFAPETVKKEVRDKSRSEPTRFAPAWPLWKKLEANNWVQVLSDDVTPDLTRAYGAIAPSMSLAARMASAKDLGEVLVVTHAVRIAHTGQNVAVIIDDGPGRQLAIGQAGRLRRVRSTGKAVGHIQLLSTHDILARVAGRPEIPNRSTMQSVYERLRQCDDGLVHISQTELLNAELWTP